MSKASVSEQAQKRINNIFLMFAGLSMLALWGGIGVYFLIGSAIGILGAIVIIGLLSILAFRMVTKVKRNDIQDEGED